jgi:hypothetical protein
MRKCWHYVYVIIYPALGYKFYYGARITDSHPDEDIGYFGSSRSFAQYNDITDTEYQSDALKVILHAAYLPRNRQNLRALNKREATLIKSALTDTEHLGPAVCLNRNIAGQIYATPETRKQWGSAGGSKARDLRRGFHSFTPARRHEVITRARKASLEACVKTYVALSPDNKRVVIRNLCAFCREHKLHQGNMWAVLTGRRKSHKNWRKPD